MQLTGKVGAPSGSLSADLERSLRLGSLGDLIVSPLHGQNYEATARKRVFFAANQSAATTTVGLATTYTGICISNPVGSPVNVELLAVGMGFIVAFPAGAALGLMTGYNSSTNVTHTTPITPASNFVGETYSGRALVDAAATLPTAPVVNMLLGSGLTGAITTSTQGPVGLFKLDGGIILPPGGYAAVYTSTVSGTSGFFGSFAWQEIPI